MSKYVTGLVVGKFAPLHNGHVHLINTAAWHCEKVIVLSYTSEHFEGCEPETRRKWLSQISHKNIEVHVLEDNVVVPDDDDEADIHREFCAEYLMYTLGTTVDVVFTSEDYGDGFAEHLTQYFKSEVNSEIVVEHVCVDLKRERYPVSGTQMRKAITDDDESMLFKLPTFVRASFVKKILFLGGESTGKSTLSRQLANKTKCEYVPEYGRELYEKRTGKLRFEDYALIARTQLQHEQDSQMRTASSLGVSRYHIFCDTSPLTTYWYSKQWCGHASLDLMEHLYSSDFSYHKIYVCAPDFPFVQDGTRQDETFRQAAHSFYIDYLENLGVKYTILYGSLEERMEQVLKDLE